MYTPDQHGAYGRLEIKMLFHVYKPLVDDCSSYTEGYRAGSTGLRWL